MTERRACDVICVTKRIFIHSFVKLKNIRLVGFDIRFTTNNNASPLFVFLQSVTSPDDDDDDTDDVTSDSSLDDSDVLLSDSSHDNDAIVLSDSCHDDNYAAPGNGSHGDNDVVSSDGSHGDNGVLPSDSSCDESDKDTTWEPSSPITVKPKKRKSGMIVL